MDARGCWTMCGSLPAARAEETKKCRASLHPLGDPAGRELRIWMRHLLEWQPDDITSAKKCSDGAKLYCAWLEEIPHT